MKRTIILMGAFVLLVGLPDSRGQSIGPSVLNATGGTQIIGERAYDWSIGEVALVNTFYEDSKKYIFTQGLLQCEFFTPVKTNDPAVASHLLLFPNPATSAVNLQYTSASDGVLSYRLMDVLGKVILTRSTEIKQGIFEDQLSIGQLAAATYFIEVSFKDNRNVETNTSYKIEKLN